MSGMPKEILFVRGNDEDSDGVVDDSVLVRSYDGQFDGMKKKVLQRMGYSKSEIDQVIKPGSKQKKKKTSRQAPPKWSVGSHCCSVFSEDGNVYEATITEIHPNKETCRIQYIGYNNEEEVPLSSLTPSQGRKACEAQMQAAAEISNRDCSANCSEEGSIEANVHKQKDKSSRSKKHKQWPQVPPNGFNMPQFPPPANMSMPQFNGMPPVMPSIVPPMPFSMMESNSEQGKAFSAMLMSWYMSGYYTGYYEALNTRRRQNRK